MYMPAQDLTIAESNRLSKFDEYIVTFNKKKCIVACRNICLLLDSHHDWIHMAGNIELDS